MLMNRPLRVHDKACGRAHLYLRPASLRCARLRLPLPIRRQRVKRVLADDVVGAMPMSVLTAARRA
ncbi:MAG: hypothetical protein HY018_03695 [Hydrogenophilales bacterium]|nr:hypothetical protein [Hydrogenophilales bacterium]